MNAHKMSISGVSHCFPSSPVVQLNDKSIGIRLDKHILDYILRYIAKPKIVDKINQPDGGIKAYTPSR